MSILFWLFLCIFVLIVVIIFSDVEEERVIFFVLSILFIFVVEQHIYIDYFVL